MSINELMRVMRPPTLLLIITSLLFANVLSKPILSHVPEHCQSYTGKMLLACIKQRKLETVSMYGNMATYVSVSTGEFEVTIDRDSQSSHNNFYDQTAPFTLN